MEKTPVPITAAKKIAVWEGPGSQAPGLKTSGDDTGGALDQRWSYGDGHADRMGPCRPLPARGTRSFTQDRVSVLREGAGASKLAVTADWTHPPNRGWPHVDIRQVIKKIII